MSKAAITTLPPTEGLFLDETDASVLIFDLRGFSALCASCAPIDLGALLTHFYNHCEKIVLAHSGRVLKFVGDAVIGVWLSGDRGRGAIAALAESHQQRPAWLARNQQQLKLPVLDYSCGLASGKVLAGQIGTARTRGFDVLGEPVNVAAKLAEAATMRQTPHLMTIWHQDFPAVEVEGIELGGRAMRLYRLA